MAKGYRSYEINLNPNILMLTFATFVGLVFLLLGGLLQFPAALNDSVLASSVTQMASQCGAVATITLCVPLVVDFALDVSYNSATNHRSRQNDRDTNMDILNQSETIVLILGILTLPIITLLQNSLTIPTSLWIGSYYCQAMVVYGKIT